MDKKYKICTLTTISKTMDWFVVDSMRNLSKNGYDVTLVSNMEEGFAERNSDYAKCISLPMSRGASVKDIFKITYTLTKLFKKEKFDIVYYTSPNASLYASLAGFLARVPKRIYSQCGLRYVSFVGIKRKIFKLVEKLTCKFSTAVRAQSPMNMQFAIDEKLCERNKISVVGIGGTIGVELSLCDSIDKKSVRNSIREEYQIPEDSFVFGYVGRVNADKGINELVQAFEKVQTQNKNVYLVLVGMLDDVNPLNAEIMQRAQQNKNIIFTGNVPPDKVYEYMAIFDVLTHPTYREGFGKVLQEAMGMSLPIITTNVPGPSEVVEDGVSGVLAEVCNVDDLYDKMLLLLNDADLRCKLAQNGRKRAETFFDRPIMLNNILKDMNKIAEDKNLL